jgi:hypothetical protein
MGYLLSVKLERMSQQMQFIGFSVEQARVFIREIVLSCLQEYLQPVKRNTELPITIRQACKIVGVSAPTLRKFVHMELIRRHDLGPKKKVFYLSELEEDIKRLQTLGKLQIGIQNLKTDQRRPSN